MTGEDLLEALARALAAAGGDAELSAQATRTGTTRFADQRVTQTGDVDDLVVQARVAVDGRVGAARVSSARPEALQAALARARSLAAAMPKRAFAGFDDGRAPLGAHADGYDADTAAADAGARAALVGHAFSACRQAGLGASGLCLAGATTVAVATSAGARRLGRYTRARFDLIAAGAGASGRRSFDGRSFGALAAASAALVDDAVARAERSRDPAPLVPGSYDVVLEPHAVAELLEWLALTSLSPRAVEDGSSALAGRLGQALTGEHFTLYDDALAGEEGCPTLPFDAEGTPRRRVTFLERGLARAVVHDRHSAAQAGAASTGHATPLGDELALEAGPLPQHLMMAGGDDSVDALIARVERGVLVSRFHYVSGLLDTRRALMTGMTRDGVWRIEGGRLGGPLANQRWTESLLEAGRRVDGVSAARTLVGSGLSESYVACPTILVRGWKFSG